LRLRRAKPRKARNWGHKDSNDLRCAKVRCEKEADSDALWKRMKRGSSYLRSEGVEAQRKAVESYLNGRSGARLVAEVVEVDSGGRKNDRPKLATAVALCRMHGGATLIIPNLGRLAFNAAFLRSLQTAAVAFVACDKPKVNRRAIPRLIAEAEEKKRRWVATRRATIATARARGVRFGNGKNNLKNQDIGGERGRATKSRMARARARALAP